MNKKVLILFIAIAFLLTACGKSLGAYWEFGSDNGNPFNTIYLESRYSCVVEAENQMFHATCTHKKTGDVESMWVKYYKHGDNWIKY